MLPFDACRSRRPTLVCAVQHGLAVLLALLGRFLPRLGPHRVCGSFLSGAEHWTHRRGLFGLLGGGRASASDAACPPASLDLEPGSLGIRSGPTWTSWPSEGKSSRLDARETQPDDAPSPRPTAQAFPCFGWRTRLTPMAACSRRSASRRQPAGADEEPAGARGHRCARLFERHARGVRPTDAGVVVIRSRAASWPNCAASTRSWTRSGPSGGTLALGVLPVASVGVLPGALIRLKATHPSIKVRLQQGRTEDLLPLLASRELDLVVGRLYEPAVPDGFSREALWEEPISVLARIDHPVFENGPGHGRGAAPYDMVLPTVSQRVGQEIEHLLSLLGLAPACRCAPPPTASSARCCWRPTTSPSCRG